MFWIKMVGVNEDGDPTLDEDCAINWTVILGRETLVETARVAAGHDKVANETSKLAGVVAIGVQQMDDSDTRSLDPIRDG